MRDMRNWSKDALNYKDQFTKHANETFTAALMARDCNTTNVDTNLLEMTLVYQRQVMQFRQSIFDQLLHNYMEARKAHEIHPPKPKEKKSAFVDAVPKAEELRRTP